MTLLASAIGDKGQRYEIRAIGYPKSGENVIGWSNDIDGAKQMAAAIRKAPGCTDAMILDRQKRADNAPAGD